MDTPKEYTETISSRSKRTDNLLSTEQTFSADREDNEIDLLDLFKQIWQRRKTIFIVIGVAFMLGLFIAIVTPEEFDASIVLMPQSNSTSVGSSSGLLGQLGGFAGISLGGSSGTLDKTLYPDITQSTSAYLALMNKEMYFPTLDTTMTLYYYFTEVDTPPATEYVKRYTLGLPRLLIRLPVRILSLFNNDTSPVVRQGPPSPPDDALQNPSVGDSQEVDTLYQPITLTGRQMSVVSKLKRRISTTIEANGMVKVSVTMPDPLVAAKTTELGVDYLTQYVTDYRIDKVRENLAFIEKQYEEKKERYNKAQQRVAAIRDRNANIVTERGRIELSRAETEYNLAFTLYQGLAQQLDQARIKVQEETPVFKILEPIQVPLSKSKPNEELIIILSLFAGIAIGLAIVVIQIIYGNIKHQIS